MLNFYRVLFLFSALIISGVNYTIQGQIWLDNKSIYDEAEGYLDGEEYDEAIILYQLLEKKGEINPNINFKIGVCYLNIEGKKVLSIPYLEKAALKVSKNYKGDFYEESAPFEALLKLGIAYRIANRFQKSIETFKILKDSVSGTQLEQLANYYLNQVENAQLLHEN